MALIPGFFGGGGGGRGSSIFDPFSLDIWDPLANFPFTGSLTSSRGTTGGDQVSNLANVRVDWKETPEAHIIHADLPGLKKEEVKVEVEENRVLQIRGEMSREEEEVNDTWHRMERSVGKFVRRFRLPENAKMDEIKATMENGVLSVVVPKAEQRRAEVKAIDIAGE